MKNEITKIPQSSVTQALAADYFCIYYVDTISDKFIEYSSSPEFRELGLPFAGDDFIAFTRQKFEAFVHADDQERFLDSFTKENVIRSLDSHGIFTMTFRMLLTGVPTYVHLKVTRMMEEKARHVVIGISSVDEQMKAREAYERAHLNSMTYSRIAQALADDYFIIYYVDMQNNHFFEYSSDAAYQELGVEKEGEDFFKSASENALRVVHPEDQGTFLHVFTKENLQRILEEHRVLSLSYRMMLDGEPTYVRMKATHMKDDDGHHVIIGVDNIDAQTRREMAYQKQIEEAENRAKDEFLTNMSHDIRTPMNAIVGYTNIAKEQISDPETVRESLDKISASSHFLLLLINDILDISKIGNRELQLKPEPCDLELIFQGIRDMIYLQAKDKTLNIRYDHSAVRHFHVMADVLRLEQLLVNIISNAIKYTPEGGSVDLIAEEIGMEESGARYRFIVRDTGIGISEEYLPYIFDTFSREQRTTINSVQGTGLGLAITSRNVALMDGTISVESKVGEGSTFTVELELPLLEEAECETAPYDSSHFAGKRILVVEDNDVNAEIAMMILEQFGIHAERAENGQIGVNKVQSSSPQTYSAILMDLQMPVMNGYDAARAIRAFDPQIPIIALSANAYEEDIQACLDAGMNAHLAKPYQPEDLLAVLQKYL